MKKNIFLIINLSSILTAVYFGAIWLARLKYNYNSEGKYFDELNSIVYDQDAQLGYGILSFAFLLIGLISFLIVLKQKKSSNKKAFAVIRLVILISLFWIIGRTKFTRNLFGIITGRGYIIPSESSIFNFKVTKMNNGSGEWWLYAEDDNYYYSMMDTLNKKPYILVSKELIEDCKEFDKFNYETWFLKPD